MDGQPPSLLPHEKLRLPESLGHPALPGTAQRKVSFRCICRKWAVQGFIASLRFRRLAGKHIFPAVCTIPRTLSRMDVVSARRCQKSRLSLAKTARSPEQSVSLTVCLYSRGDNVLAFWSFYSSFRMQCGFLGLVAFL